MAGVGVSLGAAACSASTGLWVHLARMPWRVAAQSWGPRDLGIPRRRKERGRLGELRAPGRGAERTGAPAQPTERWGPGRASGGGGGWGRGAGRAQPAQLMSGKARRAAGLSGSAVVPTASQRVCRPRRAGRGVFAGSCLAWAPLCWDPGAPAGRVGCPPSPRPEPAGPALLAPHPPGGGSRPLPARSRPAARRARAGRRTPHSSRKGRPLGRRPVVGDGGRLRVRGVGLSPAHTSGHPPPKCACPTATRTFSSRRPERAVEGALGQKTRESLQPPLCRGPPRAPRALPDWGPRWWRRRTVLVIPLEAGGTSRPRVDDHSPPGSTWAPARVFFFFIFLFLFPFAVLFLSPRVRSEPPAGPAFPGTLLCPAAACHTWGALAG